MSIYDNLNTDAIAGIKLHVEDNSNAVDSIVNSIIRPYCKDLDNYVSFIQECLADGQNPPTDVELEDWCINLSTYIYFAGGMCEHLGIRDDISKTIWKEVYNSERAKLEHGTVADKDSKAELASQQEQLTNICYNRAYRIMKSKVENAQELRSSCKKVLSRRMQEMELTRIGGINDNRQEY